MLQFFREIKHEHEQYFFLDSQQFYVKPTSRFHSVQKFTLTLFWLKFRESNRFTKEITKQLIWRNIFFSESNFSFYHTTVWKYEKFGLTEIIFRQINSLVLFSKTVTFTKFLPKKCETKIL